MPDVSGYISGYPSFVCDSGFLWEMNVESFAIFLEKVVYEHREYPFFGSAALNWVRTGYCHVFRIALKGMNFWCMNLP